MLRVAVLLLALCAGCATAPVAQSLWGPIFTLGQTEQSAAPAISVDSSVVTAAWIGADEAGVHHDARVLAAGTLSDPVTLPLPPVHPYAQQLFPAANGKSHLLWLDANADGDLRLYAALISDDLRLERGPTELSDHLALRFSALPLAGGRVLVVWSGDLLAEPILYVQEIDARGLPHPPTLLVRDADWPALARSNDGIYHLFWLRASDGRLFYGQLEDDTLTLTQPIDQGATLATGDRLHNLTAALDQSNVYLFWNLTRRTGDEQSWMLSDALDTLDWNEPVQLGVATSAGTIETGFNSGQVTVASSGPAILHQVAPMPGQFDMLPVAASMDGSLVIAYFQGGQVAGLQRIAPVDLLIGPPELRTDRDRYLYLAWSEPNDSGTADLELTTTRR